MTFADYINQASAYWMKNRENLRKGQAYFNLLSEMRPDLSEQIRGTEKDPFYTDKKMYVFLEFVKEAW